MIAYYIICVAFLLVLIYMFSLMVSILLDFTIKEYRLEYWSKFKSWIYFKWLDL